MIFRFLSPEKQFIFLYRPGRSRYTYIQKPKRRTAEEAADSEMRNTP